MSTQVPGPQEFPCIRRMHTHPSPGPGISGCGPLAGALEANPSRVSIRLLKTGESESAATCLVSPLPWTFAQLSFPVHRTQLVSDSTASTGGRAAGAERHRAGSGVQTGKGSEGDSLVPTFFAPLAHHWQDWKPRLL